MKTIEATTAMQTAAAERKRALALMSTNAKKDDVYENITISDLKRALAAAERCEIQKLKFWQALIVSLVHSSSCERDVHSWLALPFWLFGRLKARDRCGVEG